MDFWMTSASLLWLPSLLARFVEVLCLSRHRAQSAGAETALLLENRLSTR